MTALLAFTHHIAAFALVAGLAIQFALLKGELTFDNAHRIVRADLVLGIAAGIVFAAGLLRVFYFEKGADYYFHNAAFHAKVSFFVGAALLSIYPTTHFRSWRQALRQGQLPSVTADQAQRIRFIIHIELAAILVVVLCAALMARGIGQFG